jgi:hypothetical protein
VSREQLRRWQKRRLAPRGVKHGLGRGLGTAVRYPPEAAVALKFLAEAVGLHPRRLDRAGWMLWVFGLPVSEFIAGFLTRHLTRARLRDRRLLRSWHAPESTARERYLLSRRAKRMRQRGKRHGVRPVEADAILHLIKLEATYMPRADLAETEWRALAQLIGRRNRTTVSPTDVRAQIDASLATQAKKDPEPELRRWLIEAPGEFVDHLRNDSIALWAFVTYPKTDSQWEIPVEFFLAMLGKRVEDRKLHRAYLKIAHDPFWRRMRKTALANAMGDDYDRTVQILRPLLESPSKRRPRHTPAQRPS